MRELGVIRILAGRIWLLRRSQFASQVGIVAGGTAIAQLIVVGFSPIVTRLYGPEAFGMLGVFVAIAALVAPGATLAYSIAIVLPAADRDARALAGVSTVIAAGASVFVMLVVALLRDELARLFGFPAASEYLFLLPVVVFFSGLEQTLRQWLIRKGRFRAISGVAVAQAVATGAAMTGVGLVAATGPMLLVVNAAGHATYAWFLWASVRTTVGLKTVLQDRDHSTPFMQHLGSLAQTYREFPLYRAPQELLSAASQNIVPLMLAAFFGPASAGYFALSRRVLALPSALVSQSVGTVLLPRLAERARRGETLQPTLVKATLGLAGAGLLPFAVVVLFGPALFAAAFGAGWEVAGEYARWLALWLYFNFVNAPCVQAISVLGLQRQFLVYETVSTCARVSGLALGARLLGDALGAVTLFSVAGALLYTVLIVWVLTSSGRSVRK